MADEPEKLTEEPTPPADEPREPAETVSSTATSVDDPVPAPAEAAAEPTVEENPTEAAEAAATEPGPEVEPEPVGEEQAPVAEEPPPAAPEAPAAEEPPVEEAGSPEPPAPAAPVEEAVAEEPPAEEAASEEPQPEQAPAAEQAPTADEAPAAEEAPAEAEAEEGQAEAEEPKSEDMDWYILKVQSNREDSIRDALWRRVKIAGLEHYFDQVIVPTEKVTEFKGGKRRVIKRKLYPGYLVVHMEINDDTWFLVRETPGIGDFTGAAGHPTPMLPHEVERILPKPEGEGEEQIKTAIPFKIGDKVRIKEGTFENFEGEVDGVDETNGRVTVMINIFGRSTPVELEYWQIDAV